MGTRRISITFVCPKCGEPLEDVMLLSDPPIPAKKCNNCGWMFAGEVDIENIRIPFLPPAPYDWGSSIEHVPECCRNCGNHPANGGSGICSCALPYLSGEGVTC